MSRVQLSIDVTDLDAAVAFYSRLLGSAPARLRPGYANFAMEDGVAWGFYTVLEHIETP